MSFAGRLQARNCSHFWLLFEALCKRLPLGASRLFAMSKAEIDAYLAPLDPVKRATLEAVRASILEILPEATQEIYYAMPAFMVEGKALGGFAAFKNHLSWIPYSGHVVDKVLDEIAPYSLGHSQGVFKFAIDKPLPKELIKLLILTRAILAFGEDHPLVARLS